ncbi:hypothetical protein AURDEDRAFT_115947 [Auricularia subglabra TFB-10046 SS5]|uniref:Uncharacterized protein n=1 Tax=Auricularia subglabra (strain TFB-10046 / SS5) TaxID=717982 RepID=J0D1V1_AURST|nr:hypothetical protein AURDEDRAFT_115947 [Auricularia subglabra TFB-10046 SS5]
MLMQKSYPIRTRNSSSFVINGSFSCSDCTIEARAVIVDRQRELILLVYDEMLAMYTLPRSRSNDLDDLMRSPLAAAEAKSGLHCARLPLPRMSKRTVVPNDGNWKDAQASVVYTGGETTAPFMMSFHTEWKRHKSSYPTGYQLVTHWFCGYIDDENVDRSSRLGSRPPYTLLSLQEALSHLQDRDKDACKALSIFNKMLTGIKSVFGVPPWER